MINWYMIALKKYAEFNGRARRSEYWYFFLGNLIISVITSFIDGAMKTQFIGMIFSLATLIPSIAVGVRRMHDVGKSGWFLLIPIYNIILAATEGTKGVNEYGPDPKGMQDEINQIGEKLEN